MLRNGDFLKKASKFAVPKKGVEIHIESIERAVYSLSADVNPSQKGEGTSLIVLSHSSLESSSAWWDTTLH